MARLLADAGVPDGVLNVVTGTGPEAGDALLRHPGVDKIAFTGSTAVGRRAASVAGEHLKPVTMELGGNGAHLVFADADIEIAVGAIIKAFVFNTGQFCMAGPRLLVAAETHDTVVDILRQAVPGVPLGDPRDPATVIGPMAGDQHRKKVEEYVALARQEGGEIITGAAPFTIGDVELDALRPDEILVRMVAAGLCHTDLGVASGGLPFPLPGVLGHEGAGVVEQVGSGVRSLVPGDQVLLSFSSCGTCAQCRDGHPAYCDVWLPTNLIGGARMDGISPVRREGRSGATSSGSPPSPASRSSTSGAPYASARRPTCPCSRRSGAVCRPGSVRSGTCSRRAQGPRW